MLFNFFLTPLQEVIPWGEPGRESLHWFGLTQGEYWIEAGAHTLLEYSEGVRATHGGSRYCDYQVVRLYEDLFEMLPYVVEPVPTALFPYLSGESGRVWWENRLKWGDRLRDYEWETPAWDIANAAIPWLERRSLDTGYLSPSARICMWSDAAYVFVGWDNTDEFYEGLPAWSAGAGVFQLPRESFIMEVRSFHERLMREMRKRVEQVLAGTLPSRIHVDHQSLAREHEQRCHLAESVWAGPPIPTDWGKVQDAISTIEREVGHNAAT